MERLTKMIIVLALSVLTFGCGETLENPENSSGFNAQDNQTTDAGSSDTDEEDAGSENSSEDTGPQCNENEEVCNESCVDTRTSDDHCGECNAGCGVNEICDGFGDCTCKEGFFDCTGECKPIDSGYEVCGGECIDTEANHDHCGACEQTCLDDVEVCSEGSCQNNCPSNQSICAGACFDLQTDDDNCGECGNECPDNGGCDGDGGCVCDEGFAGEDCDPINHCEDGTYNCGEDKECEYDGPGEYSCTCPTPECGNAECGMVTNACGESTSCGSCGADEECSGNQCECPAPECGDAECGTVTNECGESTSCGSCGADENCSGNQCVCPEPSCGSAECGTVTNACGATQSCGSCGTDENCSGNQCVCPTPSCGSAECGTVSNSCGATQSCGSCGTDEVCSGNSCQCQDSRSDAEICADAGATCGNITDVCGGTVSCGECSGNNVCSGNSCVECTSNSQCGADEVCNSNECQCPEPICGSAQCGTVTNACGEVTTCGTCADDESCNQDNSCVCDDSRTDEEVCSDNNANCGTVTDVCGNSIGCGTCGTDQACDSNQCVCEDSRDNTQICNDEGAGCGTVTDVCGNTVNCGGCSGDENCTTNNECVFSDYTCNDLGNPEVSAPCFNNSEGQPEDDWHCDPDTGKCCPYDESASLNINHPDDIQKLEQYCRVTSVRINPTEGEDLYLSNVVSSIEIVDKQLSIFFYSSSNGGGHVIGLSDLSIFQNVVEIGHNEYSGSALLLDGRDENGSFSFEGMTSLESVKSDPSAPNFQYRTIRFEGFTNPNITFYNGTNPFPVLETVDGSDDFGAEFGIETDDDSEIDACEVYDWCLDSSGCDDPEEASGIGFSDWTSCTQYYN